MESGTKSGQGEGGGVGLVNGGGLCLFLPCDFGVAWREMGGLLGWFTGQLDILRGFASGVLCFRIPFWIGGKPL